MEFDWLNVPFEWQAGLTMLDVEESFEDPFAVKLLPDSPRFATQARFFNIGRSARGTGVFSVYRTNGKQFRVLFARQIEPEESFLYQKHQNQLLAQKDS